MTVKGITAGRGTYPAEEYAFGRALDVCQPGDVLVQDIGGERISCLGGLAAFAAQQEGLAGAVIEGGARDVDEINDCGFAVIARHFDRSAPRRAFAWSLATCRSRSTGSPSRPAISWWPIQAPSPWCRAASRPMWPGRARMLPQ